ncbi:hypothetical protein BGZ99_004215 [Dissophora globulifera]|uniref:F-box domain-containing protein n=1 Tax=Dissophora globulifera TaxID=979702 RepID=A0A9P6UU54_9FUNG|nr:hypothetical protein BGZ99_004215 [Dissophora globulifera]
MASSSLSLRPTTPQTHPLDLLEIRTLIALYLGRQELGQCILVSRKWSENFLPIYWRYVNISPPKLARCHASALQSHGQHVRILLAGRIEESSVFNQTSVAHVQELDAMSCVSKHKDDEGRGCLREILERNKESLVTLCWRCYGRDTLLRRPHRIWADMLEGLQNLVRLHLMNWALARSDFVVILRSCPVLKYLTMEACEETWTPVGYKNDTAAQDAESDYTQLEKEEREFIHNNLETLEFNGNLIPSFLRYIPRIHSLTLRHILNGDFRDLEAQLLRSPSDTLSQVKNLTVLSGCSSRAAFMALINAIPCLQSFDGDIPPEVMDDFLETVLQKHSQVLEKMVLQEYPFDNTAQFRFNFWRFLESCPQLVQLEISYSLRECLTWTTVQPQEDDDLSALSSMSFLRLYEPTKEWVCHDLKRLHLRIKDMDIHRPMDQITFDLCVDRLLPPEEKRDNSRRTRSDLERLILERLSALEKLEELNIGGGWYTLMPRGQ